MLPIVESAANRSARSLLEGSLMHLRHAMGICDSETCKLNNYPTRRSYHPTRYNRQIACQMQSLFPYCLKEVDDDIFVWMHREYQPLGIPNRDWKSFPQYHVKRDSEVVKWLIGHAAEKRGEWWFWIYKAGNGEPWWGAKQAKQYLAKLKKIISLC